MHAPPHTLVVTQTTERGRTTTRYAIECPGVTDDCRAWVECHRGDCAADDLEDNDGFGHGIEHRYVAGCWSVPLGYCFLADAAGNGAAEAADELRLPPGLYEVTATYRDDDGGVQELHLASEGLTRAR